VAQGASGHGRELREGACCSGDHASPHLLKRPYRTESFFSQWVTSLHKLAFPGVARRLLKSFDWHRTKYKIEPLFGLFWNMCINGAFEGQRRVHCKPHCDSKNIVGVCAVLVYLVPGWSSFNPRVALRSSPEAIGFKFNHKARSWLVIWEAGVIIELPPWVLVLYPSSLFLHFNIDVHGECFLLIENCSITISFV